MILFVIKTTNGEVFGGIMDQAIKLYDDGRLVIRPKDMFLSEVDHEKYPKVKQKYRFEEIVEG